MKEIFFFLYKSSAWETFSVGHPSFPFNKTRHLCLGIDKHTHETFIVFWMLFDSSDDSTHFR